MKRASKKKFELVPSQCERCSATVYTGNRSLLGLDDIKKKFGVICQDCMTDKDKEFLNKIFRPA